MASTVSAAVKGFYRSTMTTMKTSVTFQAILVSLVKIFIGIPANHGVSGVVVHCDSRIILVVFTA